MLQQSPYKGLLPYSEEDARYFFGRDRERRAISAALRASRLTVLYGETGAGKSSVLAAGVVHDLRDDPDYAIVLFRNWRDEPMAGLLNAVRDTLSKLPGFTRNAGDPSPGDLLLRWSAATNRSLLIVLDQFEEYFQYHPGESRPGKLAEELPRLLNQPGLPVNFLFAVRADSLEVLDRFKGAIPNLFDNLLRVEHLGKKAAEDAIIKPLKRFDEDLRTGKISGGNDNLRPIEIEPGLAAGVVEQIMAAQGDEQIRVQAAYLQLVMTRWWEREISKGSLRMLAETLDELGGVRTIVGRYLEDTLAVLRPEQKELAAEAFRFMVTPAGRKIVQTVSELRGSTNIGESVSRTALQGLLDELQGARLLTSVPPPRGSPPDERAYEFAHDVVAKAALEWQRQFRQAQELADAKQKEEAARRQASTLRRALAEAERSKAVARARELTAYALMSLADDPAVALFLGLQAAQVSRPFAPGLERVLQGALFTGNIGTFRGHLGWIIGLAWSPDGESIASVSSNGKVKLWDAFKGEELRTFTIDLYEVKHATWSPDGKELAVAGEKEENTFPDRVEVWDMNTGKQRGDLRAHLPVVESMAWSPDGKSIAFASRKKVHVSDASTGQKLLSLSGHRDTVNSTAWSLDSKRLATGSEDKKARVWDAATGKELLTLPHRKSVESVAWSPDGRFLASVQKNAVTIWDVGNGKQIYTFTDDEVTFSSVTWSPDVKSLAAMGSDQTVKLWHVGRVAELRTFGNRGVGIRGKGPELRNLSGHTHELSSLVWSPDGRFLASAARDGTVKLWDAGPGQETRILRNHYRGIADVAWSEDGKSLSAADDDHRVTLWGTFVLARKSSPSNSSLTCGERNGARTESPWPRPKVTT